MSKKMKGGEKALLEAFSILVQKYIADGRIDEAERLTIAVKTIVATPGAVKKLSWIIGYNVYD